jgi:hypothetical protein
VFELIIIMTACTWLPNKMNLVCKFVQREISDSSRFVNSALMTGRNRSWFLSRNKCSVSAFCFKLLLLFQFIICFIYETARQYQMA